ncbi:MAG: peptide chain release factor 3 [Actinomycetota bacterium]
MHPVHGRPPDEPSAALADPPELMRTGTDAGPLTGSHTPGVAQEAGRRRTFAIISHPDAGKSTLTEKLLLYGGAVDRAGTIRRRAGRRATTSDWMEMEQRRGISIASTVAPFEHRGHRLNLVDTPGHADFSEDTYRVLTAVDAGLMVLDAAKGVEERTLRLFEVCRDRGLPLVTFVNKLDRPSLSPLAILDDIERRIGIRPTPATWPVGNGPDLVGVVDRATDRLVEFDRVPGGSTKAAERVHPVPYDSDDATIRSAAEEVRLLDAEDVHVDPESFREGASTPVFFGSALWSYGIGQLLDAIVDLCPAPAPAIDMTGVPRAIDAPFAGTVFKVQANTDPRHRDRLAFIRVASGVFRRGDALTVASSGRRFVANHVHEIFGRDRSTLDEAYPGDILALSNARDLGLGDTLFAAEPVVFPPIPRFAPELFRVARNQDSRRAKRFRRGLEYLDQEGTIQVLRLEEHGDREPLLGAVGGMQFDVVVDRLQAEFQVDIDLVPSELKAVRITDRPGALALRNVRRITIVERSDGAVFALAPSESWFDGVRRDHPDIRLEDPHTTDE